MLCVHSQASMVLLGFATGLKFCRPPKVSIRLHSPLLFPAKNMNMWWVTSGTCRFERFKRVVWRIGTPKSQSWWRVQSFPQLAWCLEIWGISSSAQTKNIANSCCWDDCNFPSYSPDLMSPCHPGPASGWYWPHLWQWHPYVPVPATNWADWL